MSQAPIFQGIFGVPWDHVPPVMQQHYAIRPFSRDRVVASGFMNIKRSRFARLLSPFLTFAGALVPGDGLNIPATVSFYSGPDSQAFHLDRVIQFPDRPAFRFRSRLEQTCDGDVVELMRFGLGWRCRFSIEDDHIVLRHKGYILRFGRWQVPLPLSWILGKGAAREQVLSENTFAMWMTITHPVFGEIYRYDGVFEITEVTLA